MQDLNDLYLFARVVEHGGFAAAARHLGMPRSRLSRRIGLLEERLAVRLIQRSTRRFVVTPIGREYYRHCLAMLVEAEAAQEAIERSRAEPRGVVRVSCPPVLLAFQVSEMIVRFLASCPQVELRLEHTNRRVDVIREGFDLALRVRFPPIEDSELVMRELAPSPQRLVAAPTLLARSAGLAPPEVCELPSLAWSEALSDHEWRLVGPDGGATVIRHKPRFVTADMATLRRAALQGLGVVQLPAMVVEDDLAAGRLIDVWPDWSPPSGVTHMVFPTRRGLLPATRALIDHLAGEYARLQAPGRPDGGF